jgi:preprotein translocase subunit SecG
MHFLYYAAVVLFLFACFLLCSVILMQESQSMGLGASFGGDSGDSLFGTGTADVLKRFTAWLAVIFMAACIILSMWTSAMEHTRTQKLVPTMEEVGQ